MIATRSSVLSPDKPLAFCIVTWQALSFLYYYLTSPKLSVLLPDKPEAFCIIIWQTKFSVLLPDKPQAFCIITWQTPSLLYYYLANPKSAVLSPDKPQAFCIITRHTLTGSHALYYSLRCAWLLTTFTRTQCNLLEAWCCFNQIIHTYVKQSVNIYEIKFV